MASVRKRIFVFGPDTFSKRIEYPVTPPGSVSQHHFTRACTACHLCVSACPTGVLQPSLFEYGLAGMMQPFMDYDVDFCNYECTRCSEICPNGAILPLTAEEKLTTQIGVVRFEKHNCIVHTDGTACGSCSEHCPTQAVKMVPYIGELTIPEIIPDICIGCGACEYACPVTPYKAIVVDGHLEHAIAQKPEETELEEKPLEDFPF
jgi:ferredoxin-type protein NapF